MKKSYPSLSVAIQDLQNEGYTADFNMCDAGVEHKQKKCIYKATELDVIKFYRFEGMSNPADNTILYVIEATNGEKGLLVDAYGMYSGNIPKELIEKLRII